MILTSYTSFRYNAALAIYGTPDDFLFDPDGHPRYSDELTSGHTTAGVDIDSAPLAAPVSGPTTATQFPWVVTVNDGDADAVAYTDKWDWWLSAQHDWLDLSRSASESASTTYSGTVDLDVTASGTAALGTITTANLPRLLADVYVYAISRADGTVRCIDLTKFVFTERS